jgi:ankyrin repeat protein
VGDRLIRRTILLVGALLAASSASLAVDLEPARDAVRRHQYERAAELLRSPALAGDPEADFMLAQLLRFGRGLGQDLAEACRLLEQSALEGYIRAAASLASMLDASECASSVRTAEQWRELAVAGGHAPAPVKSSSQAVVGKPVPELLLRAARAGDATEVGRLLQQLPADVTDEYGRTPLMLAVEANHPDVARQLLAQGADSAHPDRNGDTALLLAVRANSPEAVDLLTAAGAAVNQANGSGVTPLMVAARAGSTGLAQRLLAAGANTDLRDAGGLRAGDYAARAGFPELAERLGATTTSMRAAPLAKGALYAGRSTLMIAAERGDMKSIEERLAAGEDVNAIDLQGMSPLAMAAAAGRAEAVDRLISAGAAIDARDLAGWTALGHALHAGHMAAALPLIHGGADVRSPQGPGKKTPLMLACETRQAALVAPLIHAGADMNAADASGTTPLIAAAAAGDDDIVKPLLELGARTDLTDKQGRTALWLAANRGALAAVRRLTPKSPLDATDAEGATALSAAAAGGFDAVLAALLAAGADARVASLAGNTSLHVAAAAGQAGAVALLAGKVGDVNAVNRHQDTPLILAVKARCADCARILLAAGASARVRNADALTAAEIARLSGDATLTALFD